MLQNLSSPLLSSPLLSPIAFFCYNRPDHTRRTLEALKANDLASESKLFIFSDGPKDNEKSREDVAKVREYISSIDGFASIEIIERECNYGCAKNIIDGITQIVNKFGRIIVVEDDILTSPCFLRHINDGLELYKDDDKVTTISGYLSPKFVNAYENMPQTFFMRGVGTWGWGTWQRVWKDYEYDAGKILKQIKDAGLEEDFNLGLDFKPMSRNLKSQAEGKVDAWDYQFSACSFLKGRLALYPGRTLTNNIGFDGTGRHCGNDDYDTWNLNLNYEYEPLKQIPVEIDKRVFEIWRQHLYANRPRSLPYRALRKLWRIVTGRNKR